MSLQVAAMETLSHDVKFGFRTLARNRSFSPVSILTRALDVGPNVAVFILVDVLFPLVGSSSEFDFQSCECGRQSAQFV